MISPIKFLDSLRQAGINFFTGIPDSLLKDVCACITENSKPENHKIANNEGASIGLAIGHYLATKNPALVYMQNSGLGNAINPLTSLASSDVYGIPMLLMIGWRGEVLSDQQQLPDEPQHIQQGRATLPQLDLLKIPYAVLSPSSSDLDAKNAINQMIALSIKNSHPAAIVVRKNSFENFLLSASEKPSIFSNSLLTRENAIRAIINSLPLKTAVISTTGMTSRELFEIRANQNQSHNSDFMVVGGMGHAIQIASGIAMSSPRKIVACIDGDGSLIMHAGSQIISSTCNNLVHIVINNGAHDSVGGQPTPLNNANLCNVARSFGYQNVRQAKSEDEIALFFKNSFDENCTKSNERS